MSKFQFTLNDNESLGFISAENIYEAMEFAVRKLNIHPEHIKCIERIDDNA